MEERQPFQQMDDGAIDMYGQNKEKKKEFWPKSHTKIKF